MVLVMAHPGFWLGDPATGVDGAAVLHAAQQFTITGDIPAQGLVESETKVTGVADRGPGKAAIIHAQTVLRNGRGEVFATLARETYIRGGGGFGGDYGIVPARNENAPDGPPDSVIDLPTLPEQALLYRLNGDLNPLHSDPDVAKAAGFAAPILHGLCSLGIVTHALLRGLADWQPAAMRALSMRFTSPVFPGEVIRTEMWRNGAFRARVPARDVVIIDAGIAEISGPASEPNKESVL